MTFTDIRVSDLTPILSNLNSATGTLDVRNAGDTVTVTCPPWTNIRTSQRVTLYIDGKAAGEGNVPSLADRLGRPPVFTVSVDRYFQPGQTCTIYLVVTEPDGSDTPNSARTRDLTFPVAP